MAPLLLVAVVAQRHALWQLPFFPWRSFIMSHHPSDGYGNRLNDKD
jgi:hypothetical protein